MTRARTEIRKVFVGAYGKQIHVTKDGRQTLCGKGSGRHVVLYEGAGPAKSCPVCRAGAAALLAVGAMWRGSE
jgi:hypothetical protein